MPKGGSIGEFERLVLLAVMRLSPNAYGVSIRREISDRCDRDVSIGAVYTTLSRLEKKGFVSSKVGEPTAERGGRAKKYFGLTAPGEIALNRSLSVVGHLRRFSRTKEARV